MTFELPELPPNWRWTISDGKEDEVQSPYGRNQIKVVTFELRATTGVYPNDMTYCRDVHVEKFDTGKRVLQKFIESATSMLNSINEDLTAISQAEALGQVIRAVYETQALTNSPPYDYNSGSI